LACERGGAPPRNASAALPLLHALEVLGLRHVFALLPSGPGGHVEQATRVPLDVLAAAAQGLNLLGAPATVLRLLLLLLLLSPTEQFPPAQRRLLRRLLVSGSAAVPPVHVIEVWKLTLG
jgi:hypothetical protein